MLAYTPIMFACDGNYRDVTIRGHVLDSLTGKSVAGSEINITCWVFDTKIWESRKVTKDTLADANGNFLIPFERGEAIDVVVRHPDYRTLKYSKTLDRSTNEVDLRLPRVE